MRPSQKVFILGKHLKKIFKSLSIASQHTRAVANCVVSAVERSCYPVNPNPCGGAGLWRATSQLGNFLYPIGKRVYMLKFSVSTDDCFQ